MHMVWSLKLLFVAPPIATTNPDDSNSIFHLHQKSSLIFLSELSSFSKSEAILNNIAAEITCQESPIENHSLAGLL
ncbi:unnamed protein product [Lactuca virosa]|uniref:Uncharacterized protein n=1 Tax=Lactuca virosa TaxID=75947 RepID=A0AAU9LYX8_9ASTR|nr:unnamed protein product [Lactuca virosa]